MEDLEVLIQGIPIQKNCSQEIPDDDIKNSKGIYFEVVIYLVFQCPIFLDLFKNDVLDDSNNLKTAFIISEKLEQKGKKF